jgi:hypothetical protein
MGKQLSLFTTKSLNINRDFKECLARLVRESGKSREEFMDRMNVIAGRFGIRLMKGSGSGLTMATFEKWLNVDQGQYMPPIGAITVICEAAESIEPLQIICGALGAEVIDEQRVKRLMWADAHIEAKEARVRLKKLEAEL